MKKLALALLLVLASLPARAQIVPAEILDKEYENCMNQGGGNPAQKNVYCMCLRNKMASWSMDTYVRIAKDVAASGAKSPILEAVTKECFNAAMRQ